MDKKFRLPRVWSNKELEKVAHFVSGRVVNVSGWQDCDKEGRKYRDYFTSASDYSITNYKAEARGFQGDSPQELYLDLENELVPNLIHSFDVVFNHTVLEHVFDVDKAFENLCMMSRDMVIVTVPFLQEQHADYGDYWRFTPLAIKKLFEKNCMDLVYINFNDVPDQSIYIFAIGSRSKNKWKSIEELPSNKLTMIQSVMLGTKVIRNSLFQTLLIWLSSRIKSLL